MSGYRQDPEADRLVAELAHAVRTHIKRRGLSVAAASREAPVSGATLEALLRGYGVGLDSFAASARRAGYALAPRGEP